MRPSRRSHTALSITRSKAKMYEYGIPKEHHIDIRINPAKLFDLTIGLLGDIAANENQEHEAENRAAAKSALRFSSYFFDSYLNSQLEEGIGDYLVLLGASAYFLCDLPGSSSVLINKIVPESLNLDANGLENLTAWLLMARVNHVLEVSESIYSDVINDIKEKFVGFRNDGDVSDLFTLLQNLRGIAYENGTARELLLADLICAITKKRIEISTWTCLPKFSDISAEIWTPVMQDLDIKELWPAQILLGEKGIFKGLSAVVQMPTSAGKTKSTELIIRSAFLSQRASLAVIVAPFRALCSEIHDNLQKVFSGEEINVDRVSDSIQTDFVIQELLGHKQVIVVTPEKLNYMLRYEPELSQHIKLLIYDEGHLFDDNSRGATYELLLASLKSKLSDDTQVILISAVISNAEDIRAWLLNDDSAVVSGLNLTPTYRTIAFASWNDKRLHFVSPDNPSSEAFYVPRVLVQETLAKKSKREKNRFFPENADGNDIALYLGLKLADQGTVAIFTGRKGTASNLAERVVELYDRNLSIAAPNIISNTQEINRLVHIYTQNFGEDEFATKAAALGVFSHHGNTPQGIRLSIEYALQNDLIKFVICTSTLAQGVNLPLRYLIVTNTRHSRESIKTRDFHNLIGRAGRSGMYTEGGILFANPELWDEKGWRWAEALQLLDPANSEPCTSQILSLFSPLVNVRGEPILPIDPLSLTEAYLEDYSNREQLVDAVIEEHSNGLFPAELIKAQFYSRFATISTIESYLLANSENASENYDEMIASLAQNTLAYSQLGEGQKEVLIQIFVLILEKILSLETTANKRIIFSRTFHGIHDCLEISSWVEENVESLGECEGLNDFIDILWPLFSKFIKNSVFKGIASEDILKQICLAWMEGKPLHEIFGLMADQRIGGKKLHPKIEHAVDICEGGFSYDGALMVGTVSQLLGLQEGEEIEQLNDMLQAIQKQMKYGLSSKGAILIYELGFSDRVLCQEMAALVNIEVNTKGSLIQEMKNRKVDLLEIIDAYPSYFRMRLNILLND